jgi:hypothetical protein
MSTANDRAGGLLAWQFAGYGENHQTRSNLLVHAATNPSFLAGTIAVVASPFVAWWLAPTGLVAMMAVVAVQGRGHAREPAKPAPFLGPLDVVARLFLEQWVTFPRFVLSGGFRDAWRRARTPAPQHAC